MTRCRFSEDNHIVYCRGPELPNRCNEALKLWLPARNPALYALPATKPTLYAEVRLCLERVKRDSTDLLIKMIMIQVYDTIYLCGLNIDLWKLDIYLYYVTRAPCEEPTSDHKLCRHYKHPGVFYLHGMYDMLNPSDVITIYLQVWICWKH